MKNIPMKYSEWYTDFTTVKRVSINVDGYGFDFLIFGMHSLIHDAIILLGRDASIA